MPAVKRYAKADKPKRLRKRKARTEVSDSSDSSDSSSSSESESSDSEPAPKKKTVVKTKAKAKAVQRSPSRSSSPEEDQTIAPSGPQVAESEAEDAFTSFYLRQMTTEFAEDLDKIRSAGDFNDKSLGLLISALKQGRECFDRHDRLAVGKAIVAANQ
ncbi:hypothetical protein D6C84_01075 [Aureobasidium pullulans]|uniref:Ribosome assembly protein 3 n=1 Tax=Aureobasidium pullulans TaxID=5580 RepID=A0A4S9Y680_AURPU|nr:hypothetical protein D6C84_01075 [Aureobasidium pullulans]